MFANMRERSVGANFDVGFENGLTKKQPVHEIIAIAAFIRSKLAFPSETTYNSLDSHQWEYFRGLLWNDDPSCYLFNDKPDNNHEFSTGAQWLWDYEWGNSNCMIQRSHFGDLQFLHGMASEDGEQPAATREKLLHWLHVMYRLACGDQGISEDDRLGTHLSGLFDNSTNPAGDKTLRDLLLAATPGYEESDIQMRALGSCLHVIQDSYAIGHTQRRLKNPEDLLDREKSGYLSFKPGTYGDWGSVLVFHTYSGQENSRHRHYDGLEGAPLPNPKDLTSFNPIIGSRSAIRSCTKLLDFYAEKRAWDAGVQDFLETQVFTLDPAAKPSDSFVDETAVVTSCAREDEKATFDLSYEVGLRRKLARLEVASLEDVDVRSMQRSRARRNAVCSALVVVLFHLFGIAAVIGYAGLRGVCVH